MALEVGAILEGKVTGIPKFGVFVALPEGKSGLVHISEVANAFVSDINEHVQMGQTVKVRVLNITDDGKINLSIKRAQDMPQSQNYSERPQRPRTAHTERQPENRGTVNPPSADQSFEDRLKKFMQESDSRIADNRMYSDRKQRGRRRG